MPDNHTAGCEAESRQMIPAVAERVAELGQLCVHYHVKRLDLFGSAARGAHQPRESDLDFLVEFQPLPLDAYADSYFGLLTALEGLFERHVDLVVGSAIENPYFLQSIEETRIPIYET